MRFRDSVDIYEDKSLAGSPVPDYSGDPIYRAVPCSIMTTAGDESFRGRQLEAHLTHVVEMHNYPNITATCRLVDRGRLSGRALNVRQVRHLDVDTKGRRQIVQIYCEEAAPQ
jgi:hypothetical protein